MTVWEYGRYLDETNADRPGDWDEQAAHPGRPVTTATWHDVQGYCEWASRTWAIECKLPTEQQWEFAARGKQGRIYPWGPEEPDAHRANFNNMVGSPTPVGMFPDGNTPDDVADMAGNVWEWTRSDYDKNHKAVRGASFNYFARYLRAADRYWYEPGNSYYNFGFRCVRE